MATAITTIMGDSPSRDFEFFYQEHFDRVYNYARHRTGSASRADEITADTFHRALKSWEGFTLKKGGRRSWLFAIAFRATADHYRSQTRKKWMTLGLAPEPVEPQPVAPDEKQQRLFEVLAKLSDQQREIVSLKFYAGMKNRAIAEILDLTQSNVAVILFRSVRQMREDFSKMESGHE